MSKDAPTGNSKFIKIKNFLKKKDIEFSIQRYFIDALRVIDEEKIRISFTSPVGPCIITSEENDRYTYLILPVRMKNA